MHATPHLPHTEREEHVAEAFLGRDHPLVQAFRRLRVRLEQAVIVAAVLSAGVVAEVEGVPAARAVVLTCVVVEFGLVAATGLQAVARRQDIVELISQGRGDLPLHAVVRERRRLGSIEHQRRLAHWLDAIREEAEHPLSVRPIFTPRVVVAAAPELTLLADRLRGGTALVRGVAATERLLTDGTSVLYGTNQPMLREELRRIRYLTEHRPVE